jgi:hypothetical protein
MSEPNLNESAWQRATADAGRIYPTTAFEVAATLMTIIFGAIAAVVSAGESTTTQIAIPILGGAVALLVTFAVVFGFQLIAAPIRQRNELRGAWEAPAIETVNVDISLRNAQRKGDDIAKRLERKASYRRDERAEAEAWADSVVQLLTGNVPDEATRRFLAVGGTDSTGGVITTLRARVNALQGIVNELGEG